LKSSAQDATPDREASDVGKVNVAVAAIASDDLDRAESLLREVCANTPADYVNCIDENGKMTIKFWDQESFLHYVL
jgi:hypothetical protein